MKQENLVKFLFFSSIILGVSSVIDLVLWLFSGFLVPSWTISGLSAAFAVVLLAFMRVIK